MEFYIDQKTTKAAGTIYRLKLKIQMRTRYSRINKIYDTGVSLPKKSSFKKFSATLEEKDFKQYKDFINAAKRLNEIKSIVDEKYEDVKLSNLSIEDFINLLDGKGTAFTLRDFWESKKPDYISKSKNAYIEKFTVINRFEKFLKEKKKEDRPALVQDITEEIVSEFYSYLKDGEQGLSNSSAASYMKSFKTLGNKLMKERLVKPFYWPEAITAGFEKRADKLSPFIPETYIKAVEFIDRPRAASALLMFLTRFVLAGADLGDWFFIEDKDLQVKGEGVRPIGEHLQRLAKEYKAGQPLTPTYWSFERSKTEDKNSGITRINIAHPLTLQIITQLNEALDRPYSPYLVKIARLDYYKIKGIPKGDAATRLYDNGNPSLSNCISSINKKLKPLIHNTYNVSQRNCRSFYINSLNEVGVNREDRMYLSAHKEKSSQSNYTNWSWTIAERLDAQHFAAIEHARISELFEAWKKYAAPYVNIVPHWSELYE
jgi:hypothetical protein